LELLEARALFEWKMKITLKNIQDLFASVSEQITTPSQIVGYCHTHKSVHNLKGKCLKDFAIHLKKK